MAGILSAIKLTEAGLPDFTVYEKADRPGGTWRENTYPGIACDVPSHLYSYSFALTPDWSHRYSPGDEIQAYFERVTHEHELDGKIRFGDEVVSCEFTDGRWRLTTAGGHRDEVDVVIAATGVLHHPNVPDIAGLDTFAGASFHSSRWDHSVQLEGSRVGIVGTGSTADADRRGDRRSGGPPDRLPADGAVDHAPGEPRLHRRGTRGVPGRPKPSART